MLDASTNTELDVKRTVRPWILTLLLVVAVPSVTQSQPLSPLDSELYAFPGMSTAPGSARSAAFGGIYDGGKP